MPRAPYRSLEALTEDIGGIIRQAGGDPEIAAKAAGQIVAYAVANADNFFDPLLDQEAAANIAEEARAEFRLIAGGKNDE